MVDVPGLSITAVAAATDVSFEQNPVPLVVAALKAIGTNNTSRVILTIHAPPGHVTRMEFLGTDAVRWSSLRINFIYNF